MFPQPVSLFESSQISGCAPLAVSFDNLSTDADQYTWFVDGNRCRQIQIFLTRLMEGIMKYTPGC